MTKTGLVYHPAYLRHDTGPGHPESPERLRFTYRALEASGILERITVLPVPDQPRSDLPAHLERVHRTSHIHRIQDASHGQGINYLDPDTPVGGDSYAVALLAVEGVLTAVDEIMAQRANNVFCAVRPPGHHAESSRAMGFCLFNNVAVAARYIQDRYELEKVMIIDWDVHHGNGTQEIFYDDPSVFYFSVHQFPLYPGSGRESERGRDKGDGFTMNCPLPSGKGDLEYVSVFDKILEPTVESFRPSFILVSAGFDAHRDDPLAGMRLTEEGFGELTRRVRRWAVRHCEGRIISCLEGGYNLEALARSIETHMRELAEAPSVS